MTLLDAGAVRGAIISNIESNATILALLIDADEVREFNWKGQEFTYPNIRVRINSITPFHDCYQRLDASIMFFSETASSEECETAIGVIANEYHEESFTQNGIRFSEIGVDPIPAISENVRTWRGEVQLNCLIN